MVRSPNKMLPAMPHKGEEQAKITAVYIEEGLVRFLMPIA